MRLSERKKIVMKSKRRLGRGYGSGRAKTAGRGTKGQKARGRIRKGFEGGQLSLVHRLPYLRGKGRNPPQTPTAFPIPLSALRVLPESSVVTLELLRKHGMIQDDITSVKILGDGKLTKKLTIFVPCSRSAARAIKEAGGTIEGGGSHG